MQFFIDNFEHYCATRSLTTLSLSLLVAACCALVLGHAPGGDAGDPRRAPARAGDLLRRGLPQHPADRGLLLPGLRARRRSTCSSRSSFFTGRRRSRRPLHRGLRLRGAALRHQHRPARPGRGGPRARPDFGRRCASVILPQAFRTVVPPLGNVLDRAGRRTPRSPPASRSPSWPPPCPAESSQNADELLAVFLAIVVALHAHHAARRPSRRPSSSDGWRSCDEHPTVLFDVPGPAGRAPRIRIGTVVGWLLIAGADRASSLCRLGSQRPARAGSAGRCCSTRTAACRRRSVKALRATRCKVAAVAHGGRHRARARCWPSGRLSDHRWVRRAGHRGDRVLPRGAAAGPDPLLPAVLRAPTLRHRHRPLRRARRSG